MSKKYFQAIGQQHASLGRHGFPRLGEGLPIWAYTESRAACEAQRMEWRKNVRRLSLEAMRKAMSN
jgi:hypothetical protein